MAKEEVVLTAKAPDRLEITWQSAAKLLGWLPFKPKKPDFADLGARMEKARKPCELVLTWDGKKLTLLARVAGKGTALGQADVAGMKPAERRAALLAMAERTSLVARSEVPPDPGEVAEARGRVERLRGEIARLEDLEKRLPTRYDKLDQGQQEVGLGNWARAKRLDRFPRFLMAVDWGRDPRKIVEEFVADGAPSPVGPKLKPATRQAILDAHAAGKPPSFAEARKEILAVVDGFLMPAFVKDNQKGLDESIRRAKAELKAEAAALKQLAGK